MVAIAIAGTLNSMLLDEMSHVEKAGLEEYVMARFWHSVGIAMAGVGCRCKLSWRRFWEHGKKLIGCTAVYIPTKTNVQTTAKAT